jgi:cytoskeletal protein CcmA (bactofilin family)
MNDRKERKKFMKKTDTDIQMLGPRSVLEGNIVFEGTLYLNGHVKGAIESRAGTIVVGEEAMIHADISVRTATIKGEIKGTVRATERLELFPPARVYGDINAPVMQIDAGVIFEGTCTIEPKENAASQTDQVQQSTKRRENTKTDEIISEATGAIPLHQKQQT